MKLLACLGIALAAACGGAQAQSPSAIPSFPELQAGKWKLRVTGNRGVRENEVCGNPLDGFREEVKSYAANTKWGCTMTANASGPRSVTVVYDCPSDRAPDGRLVLKGRWELLLVSATPQAFKIERKSTVEPAYLMEGTRIGNC